MQTVKVAIVILADTETHESLECVANALEAVKDRVSGVCDFCAGAFSVHDVVEACGAPFLSEYDKPPSFRKLVTAGYQVITF